MSLDTSTLYLVATLVAALLGVMLLFFGRQERIAALNWWGAAYILGAASVSLWTLASAALGDVFSLALNAIGFVACGMVWNAARVFHGRKSSWPGIPIGALTGMFNRRGFAEATARMIDREANAGRPVTVMIFDIDHFKSINDRFGHPAGDEVLKLFAAVVTNTLRMTDVSGRIGGEEFAALLPCSMDEALIAAERVREAFAASGIAVDDTPVETTVSIGVAGGPALTELDVLLAAADTALYQAKRAGRNRVQAATEQPLSLEGGRRRIAGLPVPQPAVVGAA